MILTLEFHHQAAALHRLPQLFEPFVRLPYHGQIGKNHSTIIRDILKRRRKLFPLRLPKLEDINVIHLDQRVLRHHGQIFHSLQEFGQVKIFAVEAMKIK